VTNSRRNSPTVCSRCRKNPAASDSTFCEECKRAKEVEGFKSAVNRILPPHFKDAHPGDFPKAIRDRLGEIAKEEKGAANLFVTGDPGVGKSHLVAAFVKLLIVGGVIDIKWTRATRILIDIRATYNGKGDERSIINHYCDWQVLALHDIGAENPTEHATSSLYEILDTRIEGRRGNLITTNLSYDEIEKREPRLASRFAAFHQFKLVGRDRRVKEKP
jgi:DNA replication protein DnaC